MKKISLLIVDDEEKMLNILKMVLEDEGYDVSTYNDPKEAIMEIKKSFYPIVLTDLKMTDIGGIEILEFVKNNSPETEVIIMTAYASAKTAVSAIKKGAYDYIIKPFEMDELKLILSRIVERNNLIKENLSLKERIENRNIIGTGPKMQEVLRLVEKVAPYETTVLITGESGTGKELVARALHKMGNNSNKPFMAISCAAIPDNLLESELFGHEKGSFTGANAVKQGLFEVAGEGTVFLDEIGELNQSLQAKLLRVLQEKEFMRVGGTKTIHCDARIIAATNRDLEKEVNEKRFRDDLYYRLSVFPINISPLRERKEDIPQLVEFFLNKMNIPGARISKDAMKLLMMYKWPGNVRELENIIERLVILAQDDLITPDLLPLNIKEENIFEPESLLDSGLSLDEIEKKMILHALKKAVGNKTEAARLLGITRRALYSRMDKHNLDTQKDENEKN